jgi:hypothetical protein
MKDSNGGPDITNLLHQLEAHQESFNFRESAGNSELHRSAIDPVIGSAGQEGHKVDGGERQGTRSAEAKEPEAQKKKLDWEYLSTLLKALFV